MAQMNWEAARRRDMIRGMENTGWMKPKATRHKVKKSITVISAQFEGICPACEGRIRLGTPICKPRDIWVHSHCRHRK